MRRILIDNVRRKQCHKREGRLSRLDIDSVNVELVSPMPDDKLLALNDALDRLEVLDGRAAELVKLCFFCGLTQQQAGEQLGISRATAERTWAFARAWLHREISGETGPKP